MMKMIRPFQFNVTERCPVCHKGTKGVCVSPGKSSVVDLLCNCEAKRQKAKNDEIERRRKAKTESIRYEKAFGNRVIEGNFMRTDGRNKQEMQACYDYVNNFDEIRCEKLNGLLLYGNSRTGKTYAAEAVAHELHTKGYKVLFDTAAGFIQRMQYADRIKSEVLRHRIATCDLLVVDDFGATRDTSFGKEAIFSVIDGRVAAKGPMVVTTNMDYADMMTATDIDDKRIMARITERCLPLEMCL